MTTSTRKRQRMGTVKDKQPRFQNGSRKLTTVDSNMMKGDQLIIPAQMQAKVREPAHGGHTGQGEALLRHSSGCWDAPYHEGREKGPQESNTLAPDDLQGSTAQEEWEEPSGEAVGRKIKTKRTRMLQTAGRDRDKEARVRHKEEEEKWKDYMDKRRNAKTKHTY